MHDRVLDLVKRVNDSDKPNLLTARGLGGGGSKMQSLPALGVPAYYWGTNCLHSLNGGQCVVDSNNQVSLRNGRIRVSYQEILISY